MQIIRLGELLMGYYTERCPGCGRSVDDLDEEGRDYVLNSCGIPSHSPSCPVYPHGELMLFNMDISDDTETSHYASLGLLPELHRAEDALRQLKNISKDMWNVLVGRESNPGHLTVYEAIALTRRP